ncbi:MAG TPA: hypothetical protein VGA99_15000 [bacterium]
MKTSNSVLAILTFSVVVTACSYKRAVDDFAQARTKLLEVSMKADSAGMVDARQRFENLLQEPQISNNDSLAALAHYYSAFANWQLAFVTFGKTEDGQKLMSAALAHLKSATEKKENLVDAYVVTRRCLYWRYVLDPTTSGTVWSESKAALEKARTIAPESPLVMLEEAIDLFYKPAQVGGDQQKGLALFQKATRSFDRQPDEVAYRDWWQATANMMLGQAYLGVENPEKAEEAFRTALSIQPNFEYVKSAMLPMTQLSAPPTVPSFDDVGWTNLAADSAGDGVNPNWADVTSISHAYHSQTDTLWFKLDLSRLPNLNAFGINLVVDTDQNQHNGSSWWGGNRTFKYDKLVTVWVVKTGPNFRGTVGIADARGVQLGRFTNLFHNNLSFKADGEKKTMVLGLKSSDLDDDGSFNLVAAVGSNAGWNDDIPNVGSITIELR